MTPSHVIGAWRGLRKEPTSSPSIERFVGLLTETPYPWRAAPDGKIRAQLGETQVCVITGAVRYWTRIGFSVGDWVRAADVLGLSYAEAGLIVEAADDFCPTAVSTRRLRRRLFAATRIGSLWTPTAVPDRIRLALFRMPGLADRPEVYV